MCRTENNDTQRERFHLSVAEGSGKDPLFLGAFPAWWRETIPQPVQRLRDVLLPLQRAYSPQLQPSERLWPLIRVSVANECFRTIDALQERIVERCRVLLGQADRLRRLTLYHWWNDALIQLEL